MKTNRKTPTIRRYSPHTPPNPVPPVNPVHSPDTDANSAANDHLVITGFCGLGIPASEIQPRVNVLTFGMWIAAGRRVKRGEHGIKIKGRNGSITVFHINQTERIKAAGPQPQPFSILDPQPAHAAPARRLPAWLQRSALVPA